ncbi:hypothetical protein ENUP19_0098G0009 [Entamoeba nuttalli]|uniref:Zinc finger domain containing protein n=2 Tax=Entamoeba nuttalli TaxID=412467 RepID=K2H8N2_ENTNP|nr:zinc finger domain containing protein [Entamoeba nuttalli P19]EKE42967.1 zinc finger domain containing protein [Entamoeba nuttalli P19]|eukprot:XP_008854699.1 zinc finger domain containing protein [Entamoeba nuttalli P19]
MDNDDRFNQLNALIRKETLNIKGYCMDDKRMVCVSDTNTIICYKFDTQESTIHTPPPLIKSAPVISIDCYDDLILTISSDFTVLVIEIQTYRVFYRQVIAGATKGYFLSPRIFTLYSKDKTLRVIEYPDPSILGFGQRGHVDVLSNSCLTHVTAKTKEVGQFMLATSKSVFLWLCDLNDEKMNRNESKYQSCIPPFTCPPTEYYLYKKIQSISSPPLLQFQKSEILPHICILHNNNVSLYEERFDEGKFTVELLKEIEVKTPISIICCDTFILTQYNNQIQVVYGKGEKEIINNTQIEECQNNEKVIVMVTMNMFKSIDMPTEDEVIDEIENEEEQLKICIETKGSIKMKRKGKEIISKMAKEGKECWEYAKELECIDTLIEYTPKEQKETILNKVIEEIMEKGKKIEINKKNVWEVFVNGLKNKDNTISERIIGYYSNVLDIASVISICIEYSRYSTIFTLYRSLGKKTIEAFLIVSHNILNHGITPTSLVDEGMKKNIEMIITNAQRCNAEGNDKEMIDTIFNNTHGMSLIEAGIIVCKEKTIDVMRDIREKKEVISGLIETMKSPITEVKECVAREVVRMKYGEQGMKEAIFIVLTSKDYNKEDEEMCNEGIKECVKERSGTEIDKIVKAAFSVNNKKILRRLKECETARDALMTMDIIQKGDVWNEIERWIRKGIERENVEKTVKKFTKRMYEMDIKKTIIIGVKYVASCGLYCLVQPNTPHEIIYEYGRILMNDPSPIIQRNMSCIVMKVIESCYEMKKDTKEIRQIINRKTCDLDKVIQLALKFKDERTVLMIRRKKGEIEECFKNLQRRSTTCLNELDKQSQKEEEGNEKKEEISEMYEGIMEDLQEVSETCQLTDITKNEECVEVMKKCNEIMNRRREYYEAYNKMYREIVEIECSMTPIKESIQFCCKITEGVLLRMVLNDLIKQSQSKLTMYKTLQIIANEQLKQSTQRHNKELKKGVITRKECIICHKEKDEILNVFGCGHSYHSTCLNSSGICLECNHLMN